MDTGTFTGEPLTALQMPERMVYYAYESEAMYRRTLTD
jgi:hypothetical protein